MKNLKKVLALALVFAMTLTLFAGAAFSDQDTIGGDFVDDVNMLVELGVLKGYEDNSFRPQNNVTRAEFAKMAYTLKYGADDQGKLFSGSKSEFTDVEGVSSIAWAKGYINYCANQKIISGVGNNKFNPNGNVTVAEAAKMLLVILGCDPQTEGLVGANWQGNTVAKAIALGVFDGWTGDPTQPATRELVAKLMRNAIFCPMYIYSPITGAGSQMQIMDPTAKNPTLGEETMGLQHVTGIVVANEFNSISTDAEGAPFVGANNWEVGDGFTGTVINPTGKEQTRIMYEYEDEDGDVYWKSLYLPDLSLSDDMLGNLVDVYYTYETKSESSKINVIGNVLVNSKTVVYEVAASDIDMMPNGESRKAGTMRPEIAFTVDGEDYTVSAPGGTARVDIKGTDYDGEAFINRNLFYSLNAAPNGDLEAAASIVEYDAQTIDPVIANMGKDVPTSYRLVSIDGGASISYIFSNPNYTAGTISSYNEAKGTIAGSKVIGSNTDLEDIVVYDGLKKGDFVVATVKSGKIVLEPTSVITGSVSSYSKNTAVINDETYVGSEEFLLDVDADSLSDYYSTSTGRGTARGATYIVYGNMILGLDEEAVVDVDLGNYAVVLKSAQDEDTGEAIVRLGLTDGSDATYTVSYFVDKKGDAYDAEEDDFSAEFANNSKVGYIVSYDVKDGKVELTEEVVFQATGHAVKDGGIVYEGESLWANDASTMFLLYTSSETSRTVRFKTYKLEDMADRSSAAMPVYTEGDNKKDLNGAAVLKTSKNSKDVLMGVMTYGVGTPSMLSDGEAVGYIVDSVVEYDGASRKNYLEVSLIGMDEKALISGKYMDAKTADLVGSAGTYQEGKNAKYAIGSIAQFAYDGTDFTALDVNALGSLAHQEIAYDPSNEGEAKIGFFKVTIADANKSRISFYSFGETALADQDGVIDDSALTTVSVDEHDYDVVAIFDDEPAGTDIEEISKYDEVYEDSYNAIIEIDSAGKIVKVFSLHGLIG